MGIWAEKYMEWKREIYKEYNNLEGSCVDNQIMEGLFVTSLLEKFTHIWHWELIEYHAKWY